MGSSSGRLRRDLSDNDSKSGREARGEEGRDDGRDERAASLVGYTGVLPPGRRGSSMKAFLFTAAKL